MIEKYYEVGGKLYEAVTACGLEDLNVEYVWNPSLLLMRVIPDFVIPSEEKPEKVILVTHSTSSYGTKMKFLRNIDELFEIKTRISPHCKALNMLYSSKRGWKTQLITIFDKVFDGNLVVFKRDYGEKFLELLHRYALRQIKDLTFDETKKFIKELLESCLELREIYEKYFLKDLENLLNSKVNTDLLPLWKKEYEKVRSRKQIRSNIIIRNTYFKRGLIKASFLTDNEIETLSKYAKSSSFAMNEDIRKIRSHLEDLKLISTSMTLDGEQVQLDEELHFVLERMQPKEITSFLEFARKTYPDIEEYLFKIKDTNKLRQIIKFFCQELKGNDLSLSAKLFRMIKNCRKNAEYLGVRSKRNWVLEICIDIIKYFKPQLRYSYDVLSRETNLPMIGGFSPIPMFIRGEKDLSEDYLKKISEVLANHLTSIGVDIIEKNLDNIVKEICQQTLVTLAKHRTINLLKLFTLLKLKESGCKILQEHVPIRSCLSAYAGARTGTADSIYTFKIEKDGLNVIVDVIAAYEQTHKHKEMSARIRMSRYQWNEKIKNFEEFKEIDKWILVLDGPWEKITGGKTKFFEMLYEAGWDYVTYPDQLKNILNFHNA
jgi:hypothetical protein